MQEEIRLTQFSHGSGCGCKIAPQILEEILDVEQKQRINPLLLVGNDNKDDAAAYQINEHEALISTTDFFTPIVDDAFIFGQVAAANAISDVYAMGGKPILALAILGWPVEQLPIALAQRVLEGARSICEKANIPLAGGHSIDSKEPIFGLSVNGLVPIKHLKQNNKAQEGDFLFLTKAIGVGAMATAAKRGVIALDDLTILHQELIKLNNIGESLGEIQGVHAMTDVTGFGLAGHLIEMTEGSTLSAEIEYVKIPKIQAALKYLEKNIIPDATFRNWKSYHEKIELEPSSNPIEGFKLLPDPQTNGGLLIAVSPSAVPEVIAILNRNGFQNFVSPIGKLIAQREKILYVK